MGENLPIVLIEVVLIFGGAVAFAWWQLHEIKVDQRKAAAERAAQAEREAREAGARDEPSQARPAAAETSSPVHAPPPDDAS